MSDVFEVAFSGQIADGADLDTVKAAVGKIFKADDAKLAQLFSGKRIVIKKNIDEATARKYKAAFSNAGAICEIKNLSQYAAKPVTEEVVAAPPPEEPAPAPAQPATANSTFTAAANADYDIPDAPNTVPLDVTGDQIADLSASLAPVGSDMQDAVEQDVVPPTVPDDITMAPVGSDLAEHEEKPTPPPPDTSGMSIVDN